MAKAEIRAGICGFTTFVEARGDLTACELSIRSECMHVQRVAEELTHVDPLREIDFRGEGPRTLQVAAQYCKHPACPVPVGILKVVEVESGLALPADVTIRFESGQEEG